MPVLRICLLAALAVIACSSLPATPARAGGGPGNVTIDALSALYRGVAFDHAMHESVAGDCATCHHHTTGGAPQARQCAGCHAAGQPAATVSCQGCHLARPFSAEALRRKGEDINLYHADKVGLKAAYHLSCMGCHQEMGGPLGCEDCHARTDAGDAFYHAGDYAPPLAPAGGSGH